MTEETKTRYKFPGARIVTVEEKFEHVNWRIDPDTKQTTSDARSLGWWVRWEGSSAMYFGPEKPDFKVGDRLRLSVERE
jgi:hypothetical protein